MLVVTLALSACVAAVGQQEPASIREAALGRRQGPSSKCWRSGCVPGKECGGALRSLFSLHPEHSMKPCVISGGDSLCCTLCKDILSCLMSKEVRHARMWFKSTRLGF